MQHAVTILHAELDTLNDARRALRGGGFTDMSVELRAEFLSANWREIREVEAALRVLAEARCARAAA